MHSVLGTLRAGAGVARHFAQLATHRGRRVSLPFFDDTMMAATLAVRPHERCTLWRYKPLIVEAMRTIVPDESLTRTTKPGFLPERGRDAAASSPAPGRSRSASVRRAPRRAVRRRRRERRSSSSRTTLLCAACGVTCGRYKPGARLVEQLSLHLGVPQPRHDELRHAVQHRRRRGPEAAVVDDRRAGRQQRFHRHEVLDPGVGRRAAQRVALRRRQRGDQLHVEIRQRVDQVGDGHVLPGVVPSSWWRR
jgi:hypothetical protein